MLVYIFQISIYKKNVQVLVFGILNKIHKGQWLSTKKVRHVRT